MIVVEFLWTAINLIPLSPPLHYKSISSSRIKGSDRYLHSTMKYESCWNKLHRCENKVTWITRSIRLSASNERTNLCHIVIIAAEPRLHIQSVIPNVHRTFDPPRSPLTPPPRWNSRAVSSTTTSNAPSAHAPLGAVPDDGVACWEV